MEYGRLVKYIKYKSEECGIKVSLVKEYYTSQTCPNCFKTNKSDKSDYKCNYCGLSAHRDWVGAFGILNKKYKVKYIGFKVTNITIK